MSPDERRRFARQISLAEIGLEGQARLMATSVRSAETADARVARWAEEHAVRAGARCSSDAEPIARESASDVRALSGRPALDEAAAFLLGSLAALEHVRRTVLGPNVRPFDVTALAPLPLDGSVLRASEGSRTDR